MLVSYDKETIIKEVGHLNCRVTRMLVSYDILKIEISFIG